MSEIRCKTLRLVPDGDLLAENAEGILEHFSAELDRCADAPVVLDLTAVLNVDSIGVNVVIGLYRQCEHSGREFSVEVADPHVLKLFKLFTLDRHFEVREV